MHMETIKLKREKENFNQNIEYKIYIDNQEITRLKNGEKKVIEINEKAEFLEAKINSGLSQKLPIDNLSSNQVIVISGNRFRNKYLKFAGALIPLISLTFILKHDYQIIKVIGGIIFIAYLLFIIYVLTFEKRKWINLQLEN